MALLTGERGLNINSSVCALLSVSLILIFFLFLILRYLNFRFLVFRGPKFC